MYKFVKFDADQLSDANGYNTIIETFSSIDILLITIFSGDFRNFNKLSDYTKKGVVSFLHKLFSRNNILISINRPVKHSMSRACSLNEDAYRHKLEDMYSDESNWFTVLHDFSIYFDYDREAFMLRFYEIPYHYMLSHNSMVKPIYDKATRIAFIDEALKDLG